MEDLSDSSSYSEVTDGEDEDAVLLTDDSSSEGGDAEGDVVDSEDEAPAPKEEQEEEAEDEERRIEVPVEVTVEVGIEVKSKQKENEIVYREPVPIPKPGRYLLSLLEGALVKSGESYHHASLDYDEEEDSLVISACARKRATLEDAIDDVEGEAAFILVKTTVEDGSEKVPVKVGLAVKEVEAEEGEARGEEDDDEDEGEDEGEEEVDDE